LSRARLWSARGRAEDLIAKLRGFIYRALRRLLRSVTLDIVNNDIRVWGDPARVQVSRSARMVNTLFNTSSGRIVVGDYTFTGHNVSLITGTHDYESLLEKRMTGIPHSGRDIIIGDGVWIGSNAVVLGPCTIGDHAVIGAGAVVLPGSEIPACAVAVGVPARPVKSVASCGRGREGGDAAGIG